MTFTEILNDIKSGKQPQPLALWVEANQSADNDSTEKNRIQEVSQAQSTVLSQLVVNNDGGIAVAKLLNDALKSRTWSFGRDAIPVYMSVISVIQSPSIKKDPSFLLAISAFEQAVFHDLPEQARVDILNKRLLSIIGKVNIVAELQINYAVEEFWDDGSWAVPYKEALLRNQEMLGQRKLTLNNVEVSPTVANWIQDFMTGVSSEFTANPGTYDQVHYINSSPAVAQLKPSEKGQLSGILHLFNWLTDPHVNEEELAAYEATRSTELERKLGVPHFEPVQKIVLPASILAAQVAPSTQRVPAAPSQPIASTPTLKSPPRQEYRPLVSPTPPKNQPNPPLARQPMRQEQPSSPQRAPQPPRDLPVPQNDEPTLSSILHPPQGAVNMQDVLNIFRCSIV